MYYLHSKQIIAQIGAWPAESQEDRLDRLHKGDGFLGLAARINLDGSYELTAYDRAPELGSIPLIEPGLTTLSDEGLKQLHEALAPRARAYGIAEDDQSRSRVFALSYDDLFNMVTTLETVEDQSNSILYPDHRHDFCSSVPSGLSEREVIDWVYKNLLSYVEYANRDEVARFMLDYYPEIEAAREFEATSNKNDECFERSGRDYDLRDDKAHSTSSWS